MIHFFPMIISGTLSPRVLLSLDFFLGLIKAPLVLGRSQCVRAWGSWDLPRTVKSRRDSANYVHACACLGKWVVSSRLGKISPSRLAAACAIAAEACGNQVRGIQSSSTLRQRHEMVDGARRLAAPVAHPAVPFDYSGSDFAPVMAVAAFGRAGPLRVLALVDGAVVRGGAFGAAGGAAQAAARETRPSRHGKSLRLRNRRS
jgi:hypothetical protein